MSENARRVLKNYDASIARDGQEKLSGIEDEILAEWAEEGEIAKRLASARHTIRYDSFYVRTESIEGPTERISLHIVISDEGSDLLYNAYSIFPAERVADDFNEFEEAWCSEHLQRATGNKPINHYWPARFISNRAALSARYITTWLAAELEAAAKRVVEESTIYDLIDDKAYERFVDFRLEQEALGIARRFGIHKASGRPIGSRKPKEKSRAWRERDEWIKKAISAIQERYIDNAGAWRETKKEVARAMNTSLSTFSRRLKEYGLTLDELLEMANQMSKGKGQENSL